MAYLHLKEGKSVLLERTTKASFVVLLISGFPDMLFGSWETLWYLALGLPVCLVSYMLNRHGRGQIAGNIFAIGVSLVIFLAGMTLAKESSTYLYYLPFIVGLPFLIDYNNKIQLVFHGIHISLFWLILVFYDNSRFIIGNLSAEQMKVIGQVNMVLAVFFCQFFVFQIVLTNRNAESAIVASEQKLRLQNDNLKKGNQELDKFVYSVSHDLRSPVASVLGLTNLGKQEDSLAEMHEYTRLMERSLLRMDSYILDILDYSRNTRLPVKHEEIDFFREIEDIVESCRHGGNYSNVDVSVMLDSKIDPVQKSPFYTDRYRLRIVLKKVIFNAFYYQKPEPSAAQIQIICHLSPMQAIVRVRDNGIGIVTEDIEKIFTMFYRSNVTKPGSGLGLYIARESAGRIGGKIMASSQEGIGSEFLINLPNLGKSSVQPERQSTHSIAEITS